LFSEKFHKTLDFKTKIHQNSTSGRKREKGRKEGQGRERGRIRETLNLPHP